MHMCARLSVLMGCAVPRGPEANGAEGGAAKENSRTG